MPLIHDHDLTPSRARELLRRLRDLDLRTPDVRIRTDVAVRIDGCLSVDAPVEHGVRYRLIGPDGREHRLCIRIDGADLELTLDEDPLRVELRVDDAGRTASPSLSARLADSPDSRAVEHFMRRIVRGLFAA